VERRSGNEVRVGIVEREAGLLDELVEGTDCVIHLASSSRPPIARADPLADLESTVVPALAVMERVARAGGATRLFLASSGGTIYGNPEVLPTPEDHLLRPTTPYAITSVMLEHYGHFYALTQGLPLTIMRFANVYGPGQTGAGGQGVIGTWLRQLASGEAPVVLADLRIQRDFLYVDDAARAVAALVEATATGTYNIGSGATVALHEVVDAIQSVTGHSLDLAGGTLGGRHATADILATQLDTTAIRATTGWEPHVDLPDGIRRTWEWLQVELSGVGAELHGQGTART
jgi:UDP-glucose 4-epimerase